MSYTTVEDALATTIKLLTGYSTSNVAQGSYTVLGSGQTKAAILQPGAFTAEMAAQQWKRTQWNINIELYILWQTTIGATSTSLKDARTTLIDHLDKYPTLGSTAGVVRAMVTEGREPELWQMGAQQFWKQILVMQVEERGVVSYAANG